jgi:catechol 2,3-dioxygenase-like lactoylglutathione lyase family enzyme
MFDHVGVVFKNLALSGSLYRQILREIEIQLMEDHTQPDGTGWLVFGSGAPKSPFFVVAAGRPSFWRDGCVPAASPAHIAFRAPTREAVDRFHATGIRNGAIDNGQPGVRRRGYYCAFLLDLDGNNIEAGVYD